MGRVEKVGTGWAGGSWYCHIAQATVHSIPTSSLLVGGRGEAKELQSCSVQMRMRALGVIPCMLYLNIYSQNLQLLKMAWVGKLFYS